MAEHRLPTNTVEFGFYCKKCKRVTRHRIDDGNQGPCLVCVNRLEAEHVYRLMTKPTKQGEFDFGKL